MLVLKTPATTIIILKRIFFPIEKQQQYLYFKNKHTNLKVFVKLKKI